MSSSGRVKKSVLKNTDFPDNRFTCYLCKGKHFDRAKRLIRHWEDMHNAYFMNTTCPYTGCGYVHNVVVNSGEMAIHCMNIHGSEGSVPLICEEHGCEDYLFEGKSRLWEHNWKVHQKADLLIIHGRVSNGGKKRRRLFQDDDDDNDKNAIPPEMFNYEEVVGDEPLLVADMGDLFDDLASDRRAFDDDDED